MDPIDLFSPNLESMRDRLQTLHKEIACVRPLPVETLVNTFTELTLALEELQVAQEELNQQNEELTVTQIALTEERERYRQFFELAPDGYVVTDESGNIQEANRAAAELLKVPSKFLINKPFSLFVGEAERRLFRFRLNQLKEGLIQRFKNWEMALRSRQGEYVDVDVNVGVIYIHDRMFLQWLIRDIGDRKQAAKKLDDISLQNLALQKAAQLKNQFVATMSHELRTPMNAIIGFSQLLLRQRHENLRPLQVEMLKRISQNSQQLLSLINHILEISKLESGNLQLKLAPVHLLKLIDQITQELSSLLEPKNLSLKIKSNLANPIIVNDELRLRQILVNLLSNAIKFTDSGGITIEVEVRENDPERIVLAISDTGIGIAPEHLVKIFEPFQQVEQDLTRHFSGTGLGLSICQSLVGLMQGIIWVESEVEKGSTFYVEIPRQVGIKSSFL